MAASAVAEFWPALPEWHADVDPVSATVQQVSLGTRFNWLGTREGGLILQAGTARARLHLLLRTPMDVRRRRRAFSQ
jgi:hypothetical protein